MKWSATALILGTLTTAFAAPPAMFRVDARHAGVYDAAGVAELHGVKWTFRTGAAVISTPAVANGTVYVGSSDHNLYALDAASGALRWQFATGGRVTSSPAVAAGPVYFGSFDSNLYALDAASGRQAGIERRHREAAVLARRFFLTTC
jgi:eukaryotic-like serine/threonine-protein kinase